MVGAGVRDRGRDGGQDDAVLVLLGVAQAQGVQLLERAAGPARAGPASWGRCVGVSSAWVSMRT